MQQQPENSRPEQEGGLRGLADAVNAATKTFKETLSQPVVVKHDVTAEIGPNAIFLVSGCAACLLFAFCVRLVSRAK